MLLAIDIDERAVVLSDFYDWHFVLNYLYLALNEEDDACFQELYEKEGYKMRNLGDFHLTSPCLKECRKRIEQSWQRIFDLDRNEINWNTPFDRKSLQATFGEQKAENVQKVQYFTAK